MERMDSAQEGTKDSLRRKERTELTFSKVFLYY